MSTATDGFSESNYGRFQQGVQSRLGVRLGDYRAPQMRRRVAALAQRLGHGSFGSYLAALEREPPLREAFRSHITINVSALLRDPARFDALEGVLLPELMARRGGRPLSVWSAGCSYGAEAFSLAMLLHELSPGAAHRVCGTDVDAGVLDRACAGRFSAADLASVCPERRLAHFAPLPGGQFAAAAHLRARVEFRRHDLLADPYPQDECDLIACRNVVIYFTDAANDRLYRGFHRALRPGGLLFVGGAERLPDPRALGFEPALPFFYRKPL